MNLYTASTGSKRMDTIGEPRISPELAKTLDAIVPLHASGVGSGKKKEKHEMNEK